MDRQDIAFTFLSTSIALGLALGIIANPGLVKNIVPADNQEVHEHAMFFVEVNKTKIDLSDERFQLQSEAVHLENNRSHIVHKHQEEVTWGQFLDTINLNITRNNTQSCLVMPEKTYCGNMTVMMNGQEYDPDRVIEQGDNLAIVLGNNSETIAEAYMELDLPRAYTKAALTTRV